jgi:hypothetical protein
VVSAITLETRAWEFVKSVMLDPEKLISDLNRMIELKREGLRGEPHKEAKVWLEELAKLERMRDGYHDQAAEGLMSLDKLKEKLTVLEERRMAAERELEALSGRREELERLKRDREAIVQHYTVLAPERLESLEPEERHQLYRILGLKVLAGPDGEVWAEMPIRPPMRLEEDPNVYRNGVTSRSALMAGR